MILDAVAFGVVLVLGLGALERRTGAGSECDGRDTAVIREAMVGPDGAALRAEFRRSGIAVPERAWRRGLR